MTRLPRTATAVQQPYVSDLTPAQMRERLHEALTIYVRAMGYPASVARRRAPMWAEHALRPGWRAAAVLAPHGKQDHDPRHGTLIGIAYGYTGSRQQWWYEQVHRGLSRAHGSVAAEEMLADYFELTELHIHPSAQGHGPGDALLGQLLAGCDASRVLLSTPEVGGESNRAWRLYRRRGFEDVLREFRFDGDPRAFAVLGRALPLAASTA
ncbi:GNAT family N-acetyltransferase [Hoyosella sp. G463]|uniref:GNAT family N-acetyltransferase n=1 Tax=Lolliginicoccus lacisalsi TaxID=2742202 RepID=A0A927JF04_9ACTN|nr:GNAT family N-acetyltransferase [Lolliginicoccus lacisalsi]MBD8507750.1 GNAT family N-acetyltransferase [Lolliginicoccus lacisalsi]